MPRAVDTNSAADRLRRLEAVTDTALAHLTVEEVLQELLDRVRDVLSADTATVLLLDSTGEQLVATASSGIEEEVHQGTRVPVGKGFAGRIAADAKPYALSEVSSDTVVNPILWTKGIRSLAGVPLVTEGRLLGILHVGALTKRIFSDEDVHWLQLAGDRIALAVHSRLSATERDTAVTLQRSLLPTKLPDISGLDLASRYVPSEDTRVSGDWYDVFPLPSGWVGIAIGDVVGRGLPATVIMSRIRTALRSYALESKDPAEALSRMDRHTQHFEPGTMATVAYGMWEPSLGRVHLSLAGHLTPVLVLPDGNSRLLTEITVDAPIGVSAAAQPRHNTVVDTPDGATMFLYTDGLIERRNRPLDEGLRKLCEAVRISTSTGPAELLAAEVMNQLVGAEAPADDVAVLVARRQSAPDVSSTLTFDINAVPEALADVRAKLRRWLPAAGASEDDVADLLIAVGEAVANSIEHAYGPQGGTVALSFTAHDGVVDVIVADTGAWRAPRGVYRGRGTELMRQLADEFTVDHGDAGTAVRLRKRLSEDEQQ